jgi:hypothetical protein
VKSAFDTSPGSILEYFSFSAFQFSAFEFRLHRAACQFFRMSVFDFKFHWASFPNF